MGPNINNHVSLLRNINSVDSNNSLCICILFVSGFDMMANRYLGEIMEERDLPNMVRMMMRQYRLRIMQYYQDAGVERCVRWLG
mmetsp:Transcript_25549/g.54954  ORF Transcript_25549/g.54954 Transcript_25549/m.54954 type:complete len:84 (-) Transcript_25549:148-399(-)